MIVLPSGKFRPSLRLRLQSRVENLFAAQENERPSREALSEMSGRPIKQGECFRRAHGHCSTVHTYEYS